LRLRVLELDELAEDGNLLFVLVLGEGPSALDALAAHHLHLLQSLGHHRRALVPHFHLLVGQLDVLVVEALVHVLQLTRELFDRPAGVAQLSARGGRAGNRHRRGGHSSGSLHVGAHLLGRVGKVQDGEGLVEVLLSGADVDDHSALGLADEEVSHSLGQLRLTVRDNLQNNQMGSTPPTR